jgi:hypothetical protein
VGLPVPRALFSQNRYSFLSGPAARAHFVFLRESGLLKMEPRTAYPQSRHTPHHGGSEKNRQRKVTRVRDLGVGFHSLIDREVTHAAE